MPTLGTSKNHASHIGDRGGGLLSYENFYRSLWRLQKGKIDKKALKRNIIRDRVKLHKPLSYKDKSKQKRVNLCSLEKGTKM